MSSSDGDDYQNGKIVLNYSGSNSDGEDAIVISSHSRILISPKRIQSSLWGEKNRQAKSKSTLFTSGNNKKNKTITHTISRGQQHMEKKKKTKKNKTESVEREERTHKDSDTGAELTATKSTKKPSRHNNLEASAERKKPIENETMHSIAAHNENEAMGSDKSIDDDNHEMASDDGNDNSSIGDDNANETDQVAIAENTSDIEEEEEEEEEEPVLHKTVSKKALHDGITRQSKSRDRDQALQADFDALATFGSTKASVTQEMDELKQTLKKLARHNDNVPITASTSAPGDYLKASAAFTESPEQIRLGEFVNQRNGSDRILKSMHHSSLAPPFTPDVSPYLTKESSTSRTKPHGKSKSVGKSTGVAFSKAAAPGNTPSLNKKLFGQNRASATSPYHHPATTTMYPSGRDTPLSYTPTSLSSGGSMQGSRAVLSALKALQDKIRRLEEERESLTQQLSDAKVIARKKEAELASSEKKFAYELGQTKESARAAYDSMRSEREELRLELAKYEERMKAMDAERQHFQELADTHSSKANDVKAQLARTEKERSRLHSEVKHMEAEHKQLVEGMKAELTKLQHEKQAANQHIRLLEDQIEREASNHAEARERLRNSEETVVAVSQLNEKMVAKVWELTEQANKITKKNKQLQQQQRVSTLSRSTAASRAGSVPLKANEQHVPARKKKTVTGTGGGSAKTKKKVAKSSNNMEKLRNANLGKEIPFLLGRSASKSHSLIGNVQDAIRQCDTTYVTPVTNPNQHPLVTPSTQSADSYRVAVSPHYSATTKKKRSSTPKTSSSAASILGLTTPTHSSATLVGARTRKGAKQGDGKPKPDAIKIPTAMSNPFMSPMQSQIMEDLGAAVSIAEKEFTALNDRYKDIVARMEQSGGSNGDSAHLSNSLGPILDELEAKGKQVNLLQQVYKQASNSTINPLRRVVHSPEAIRRKTASLRLLNEYRQLEREAKTPRATVTIGGHQRRSFFQQDHDP